MGNAVKLAAQDVLVKLQALADELDQPFTGATQAGALLRKKFGMPAGTVVGTGSFMPPLPVARCRWPLARDHAKLDDRRHWGRGRGRHRDRPFPACCASRTSSTAAQTAEPQGGGVADLRRGHHATRHDAPGEDGVRQRRPAAQRLVLRIQDSRACSMYPSISAARRSTPSRAPAPTVPKASVRAAASVCRPPSRRPSTTRWVCASCRCPSHPKRCSVHSPNSAAPR